jgi:hypothetical protein
MGRRGELRRKLRDLNRNHRSLVGTENIVKNTIVMRKRGYFLAIFSNFKRGSAGEVDIQTG